MSEIKTISIDPGWSGAIAMCDRHGNVSVQKMPETIFDILEFFRDLSCESLSSGEHINVVMEKVGAMPRDGVKAVWRFSENVTALKCGLYMAGLGFSEVSPKAWQQKLGVMPKDKKARKNKIKTLMQQSFPQIKITLQNADALAILKTCT